MNSYTTVSSGHVKVASLFGKVQDEPLSEGLHFPINPMLSFKEIDGRQKTHKEKAGIPSEDKLITTVDVSVQYRIIKSQAPSIVKNTGDAEARGRLPH
jgi:regulator of protease activity HflC (stomatin/prohibitin superfamily)